MTDKLFNTSCIDGVIDKIRHSDIQISTRAVNNLEMKLKVNIFSVNAMNKIQREKMVNNLLFWIASNFEKVEDNNQIFKALKIINDSLGIVEYEFIEILKNNNIYELLNRISSIFKHKVDISNTCGQIIGFIVNNQKNLKIGNEINFEKNNSTVDYFMIKQEKEETFNKSQLSVTNSFTDNSIIKKSMNMTKNNTIFNFEPNFPIIYINKNDEQLIFDLNINLKFGDSLQITNNLMILYYNLLNDFPIEYFLQNSDLFKNFLVIYEKKNFKEFGLITWKILIKILNSLEQKAEYFKEINNSTSHFTMSNENMFNVIEESYKTKNPLIKYPPAISFICVKKYTIKDHNDNNNFGISLRDFLIFTMESLILSLYELEKFPYSLYLMEKNFNFLKKVIFNNTDEWIPIINHILVKLHSVIGYYKNEKIEFNDLCRFFMKIVVGLTEESLIKFINSNSKILLNLIKDVTFIFKDLNDPLIINFFHKIINILEDDLLKNNCNNVFQEYLKTFVDDYNNAKILRTSIHFTKQLRYDLKYNTKEDYHEILEHFDNLLISFKYMIEVENLPNLFIDFKLSKFICDAFELGIEREIIIVNFDKMLSFINKLSSQKHKIIFFKILLEELKTSDVFIKIILLNPISIFFIFNEIHQENTQYEKIISEIILDIYEKLTLINNDNYNKDIAALYTVFSAFFPINTSSLKISSMHKKIDHNVDNTNLFLKYLRLLFHRDEMIRLNGINYLFLLTNCNSLDYVINKIKTLEFVDFRSEYEKIKEKDIILPLQSVEKEFSNLIQNINQGEHMELEFFPLLNIFFSSKQEPKMKSSAIDQLIYLIKKNEYKKVFINEILDHLILELNNIFNQENFKKHEKINSIGNDLFSYLCSLLKMLNLIIYFHLEEIKIQSLITFSNSICVNFIHNMIKILFLNIKNKHILSVYAILLLNIISFNQNNFSNFILQAYMNNEVDSKRIFITHKCFEKIYFLNLIPKINFTTFFSNTFSENITYNKHLIEYIDVNSEDKLDIRKIYDINKIRFDLNLYVREYLKNHSFTQPNYLEVYLSMNEFFSCILNDENNINNDKVDSLISDEILTLLTFFKKILPIHNSEKNLISDFLLIFEVFCKINLQMILKNKIIIKSFQDIILNYINFITNNKDFSDGLSKPWGENQILVNQLFELINNNQTIFEKNSNFSIFSSDLIQKFISVYSNLLIFNENLGFQALRRNMFKFLNIYFDNFISEKYTNDLILSIIMNVDFYLSKIDICESFVNTNFILNCLHLLKKISNCKSYNDTLIKKSFTIVKFLNTNFYEINLVTIDILTDLISIEFFNKHPIVISSIVENVYFKSLPYFLKINSINFINLSIEYMMKEKFIDITDNSFINEVITLNSKFFEDSQLEILLNLINKNISANSTFCAVIFKLINNLLNFSNSQSHRNFFFNSCFYDTVNSVLIREKENINNSEINKDIHLLDAETTKNININYFDKSQNKKILLLRKIDSLLNINESLTLLIKSLAKLEFPDLINKYKLLFNDLFINYFSFAVDIRNIYKIINDQEENYNFLNKNKISVFQEFVVKYFTYLNFLFNYDINFIFQNICLISGINIKDVSEFFILNCDLMKLEDNFNNENESINFDIKLIFSKNLPFLLQMINDFNNINHPENMIYLSLKNEEDILIDLMTYLKKVYEIKFDCYADLQSKFDINEKNLTAKNVFINSISSLLLESQICKKIFIKSNFINTFIDYIKQLNNSLLDINAVDISNNSKNAYLNMNSSVSKKMKKIVNNSNNCDSSKNDKFTDAKTNGRIHEYIMNEYTNILLLFQNLLFNFEECDERSSLLFKEKYKMQKFFKLLFDIFYDVVRYPNLFENYLKLLINLISKNDYAKKSFTLNINESKETFLVLILNYFNKNFQMFVSNHNFDLFIKFLKCLFQNKLIVLFLLKTKFIDNLIKDFEILILNKKVYSYESSHQFIENILNLFISLSLDHDVSKKIVSVSKEFIENLVNFMLKIKNDNIIFLILFLLRNLSFVTANKLHFMVNENLLGSILALLSSDKSIKIKFIISHLIWILLYNNQSLKATLNKNDFKREIKTIHIEIQKKIDKDVYLGKSHHDEYLEETSLNMRKITNILDI